MITTLHRGVQPNDLNKMYKKLSSFATFLSFLSTNFISVSYQIILFEMETIELMYGLEALSILETVAMCL